MNDVNPLAVLFGICAAIAIPVAAIAIIWSNLFPPSPPSPPSAEHVWLDQQTKRCSAMGSRLTYDPKTRKAECYRTPMMRHPKLIFAVEFSEDR